MHLFLISKSNAQDTLEESHIKVSLRAIGHQVLLSSNDSTARVLPIIKENDRYRIQFETEFEFSPDELVATINRVVKETRIATKCKQINSDCWSPVQARFLLGLTRQNLVACT